MDRANSGSIHFLQELEGLILALNVRGYHHLSIANNLPLVRVAEFAKSLCSWLIIEWVPKDDPQVRRLLRNREDIFDAYTQEAFEVEFGRFFTIADSCPVGADGRVLYLLKANG